jgi:hypothetical protein
MKVQYTLPGFVPAETVPPESLEGESPFRSRLNYLPAPRWLSWERLLRLDQPPVDAASPGPPPRPAALESGDAASERLRWRQVLDRQVALFGSASGEHAADSKEARAIERMLALLMMFRDLEDSITARHLSEPES